MILSGKCAIVTGASRPIGKAIAKKFVEEGAIVYLISRDADRIALIAQELDPNDEGKAIAMPCDITSKTSIEEVFEHIAAADLVVDILVNATDLAIEKPLEKLELEDWTKNIKTNLTGAFLLSQKCFEGMKEAGAGKIINVASLISDKVKPGIAAYVAAKGGLVMLSRSIAVEWGKFNIQANTIVNADIDLPMSKEKALERDILNRSEKKSLAEDIADVALFLASEKSNDITGKEIPVDEGFLTSIIKE